MSLTIGNPYSATANNRMKIHAFAVDDASPDHVEISPLTRLPSSDHTVTRQTVAAIPEDSPRYRQISAFLSHQAKTILEEKRQEKSPVQKFKTLSTPSWMRDENPFKQASHKPNLALWRNVFEKVMDKMNSEIWQYERRNILGDIQSVVLLVVTSAFLYQFAGPTISWSIFIIRRFSFPAACVYLIVPTLQDQNVIPSELGFDISSSSQKNESAHVQRI